jgi:capping protein beta
MEKLKACLSIMRRMPPAQTETSLSGLVNLVPDLTDELLQRVDQPLKVMDCPDTGRKYVLCDYNRDGDSYRSPWSNKFNPPLEDGFAPSEELRKLEIEANYVFDAYRNLSESSF